MPVKKAINKEEYTLKKENFALISMGYIAVLVPHKDAVKVMEAMEYAEYWDTTDYSNPKIVPIEKDKIIMSIVSHEEYRLRKMSQLLNVSYQELKDQEEGAKKENGTD